MTEREKLIDLLDEVHHCHLGKEYRERLTTIADYLIANGVTLQRWIPVTERLPEELEQNKGKKIIPCLVAYSPYGNGRLVTQYRQRKFDQEYGWYWPKLGSCSITHWMPLPAPPKEE